MVADEDNDEAWRQVAALGAMADLLKDQRSRLLAARQAMASAWSPGHSAAAQAFVDRIDDLLLNMADTKAKAGANAAHLAHVVEALRQAKEKIAPLYQRYLEKSDDWVPHWWDRAEDELDSQARQHMIELERQVAPHAEKISAPAPYSLVMENYVDDRTSELHNAHSSSSTGRDGNLTKADRSTSTPHDPPPPLPGHHPAAPVGPAPGRARFLRPTSAGPTLSAAFPGDGTGSAGLLPDHGSSGPLLPIAPIGDPPSARELVPYGKPATPSWLPVAPSRPDSGAGQPALYGMPIPAGRAVSSGSPRGPAAVIGPSGQGLMGKADQRRPAKTAGDSVWSAGEGVAPIIRPSQARHRHDPGPGVIGLDR